jgi:hypothetical protein
MTRAQWGIIGTLATCAVGVYALLGFLVLTSPVKLPTSAAPAAQAGPTSILEPISQRPSVPGLPAASAGLPTPTIAVQPPTPTLTPRALTYSYLCDTEKSLNREQLAELQRNSLGREIQNWQGWVYNVTSAGGSYSVEIGLAESSALWSADIRVERVEKDIALRLNLRQPVTFTGTIKAIGSAVSNCSPINLENATFVSGQPAAPISPSPAALTLDYLCD